LRGLDPCIHVFLSAASRAIAVPETDAKVSFSSHFGCLTWGDRRHRRPPNFRRVKPEIRFTALPDSAPDFFTPL
jgi:hypothetical protein